MELLTIETFNTDTMKAINSEQKKAGEINYTSVKFKYDGGVIPPLRIDGKFRLFRFKNHRGDIYSLSPGVWQSFVTIRSCNHLMRIISTYVDNTKKSEIS